MNQRMPLLLSLLAVIAMSASIAYWFLQLYKPEQRPLSVPPPVALAEPAADAAGTLFGGQAVLAIASNYQLTGVVASGSEGVAILVADGQPPRAVRVGRELSPGVKLSEVYPRYVMLIEAGVPKRIELAADTTAGPDLNSPMPPPPPPMMSNQSMPQPMPQQDQQPMQQPEPQPMPQPDQTLDETQQQQQQQQQLPPGVTPSPPNVQMPMPNRNFMRNPPPSQ